MEQLINEPPAVTVPATVRHDGWTGEKIAIFCETLAETAIVAEACEAARMGISGAYAARRRNPVFAAAWDAALGIARERLADTLLARSIEGNVEQIYKDGELVGERHVIDNRLGLAILRRLDRIAEGQLPGGGRGPGAAEQRSRAGLHPGFRRVAKSIDWDLAINALRTGDESSVAKALAMFDGDEVEEVEDPPVSLIEGDTDEEIDEPDRCWTDDSTGEKVWMTSFPPPAGFDGYEKVKWGRWGYERECTDEEVALLEAGDAAAEAQERARAEALRDAWFAELREELDQAELGSGA
jgi:hypothetical protein